jgi:hypothetical protein
MVDRRADRDVERGKEGGAGLCESHDPTFELNVMAWGLLARVASVYQRRETVSVKSMETGSTTGY